MILAAGLGTRLRPLSDLRAKCLVPVGDQPALAHVIGSLQEAGMGRIVVNAHHRADEVTAFVRDRTRGGRDVIVSEEPDLLGTAGGLAKAHALLGPGDVLVWNADIFAPVDIRALVAAHARTHAIATLVVAPLAPGTGPLGLDSSGCVVRMRQHRFGAEATGAAFLGVHVLGAPLRERLPAKGGLVEDVFVPALARGETLRSIVHGNWWCDVGTPESYLEANMQWLRARGFTNWVGPDAFVGRDVWLDRSVVGAGAKVEGSGALARCVVWPGARAVAPLEGVVVTS